MLILVYASVCTDIYIYLYFVLGVALLVGEVCMYLVLVDEFSFYLIFFSLFDVFF